MNTSTLANEIAALERQIKSAPNATAKKALESKIAVKKAEMKSGKTETANSLATKLLKAKGKVKELSSKDFNDMIKRLSQKPEYKFLKSMSREEINRDIQRPAKPLGWRFKGKNSAKPTKTQIATGRKNGTVYFEDRKNRSDISRVAQLAKGGGVMAKGGKIKKGDIGKSGTQYGYTLKEYEENAEKNGLFVSPKEWWKSIEGKKYTDSLGRTQTIGNYAQDESREMRLYGYHIAIGMDLGSDKIPASARKYVIDNNLTKEEQKYATGGGVSLLKEDDYVWNAVGKKLIVDKITEDEYYLIGFGQRTASPFSREKVDNYIKKGEWTLKPKMATGGGVGYEILDDLKYNSFAKGGNMGGEQHRNTKK